MSDIVKILADFNNLSVEFKKLEAENKRLDKLSDELDEEASKRQLKIFKLQDENKLLKEALEFYANPETYFAIGFMVDKPCGEFAEDCSETALGMKPGKKARVALSKIKE